MVFTERIYLLYNVCLTSFLELLTKLPKSIKITRKAYNLDCAYLAMEVKP